MGVIETIKRQEREKGLKTGIEKGKMEAKREQAIAIAIEFKKMGLPTADITKGTGLSVDQIEKL